MVSTQPFETEPIPTGTSGHIEGIPVRNLWLLMWYASDLFRSSAGSNVSVEENPDEIPDLIAFLLAEMVEKRLRRNLTLGYRDTEADLHRVRGRINVLATERRQLMARGMIACRFDELTIDTPRNRYVSAALNTISSLVGPDRLAQRCRALAKRFRQLGVRDVRPRFGVLDSIRFGSRDAGDRRMVAAARLAFDLKLPTELAGTQALVSPDRQVEWIRRLFEKAVAGFYDVVMSPKGWNVHPGKKLRWLVEEKTMGMESILPSMQTDITLENQDIGHRIVIDTKFNAILVKGQYQQRTLRSQYLYQIYAYLRSQESPDDPYATSSTGLLLHPAVGFEMNEAATIQGHEMRFATVDLAAEVSRIREQLIRVIESATPS